MKRYMFEKEDPAVVLKRDTLFAKVSGIPLEKIQAAHWYVACSKCKSGHVHVSKHTGRCTACSQKQRGRKKVAARRPKGTSGDRQSLVRAAGLSPRVHPEEYLDGYRVSNRVFNAGIMYCPKHGRAKRKRGKAIHSEHGNIPRSLRKHLGVWWCEKCRESDGVKTVHQLVRRLQFS